jgi:hypothetical protein
MQRAVGRQAGERSGDKLDIAGAPDGGGELA